MAGTQGTALQVAELVEDEQRVITGTAEVAIVAAAFLLTVGGADAGIDVEDDRLRAISCPVDPGTGEVA